MEHNASRGRVPAPRRAGPDPQLAGRRVLLVEGNVLIALCSQLTLRELGCDVVGPALRMRQAVALARSEPLDGAFIDADMADRAETLLLTEVLARRGVPVVLSTGLGMSAVAASFPGCRVIVRPASEAAMERAVRDLLAPVPAVVPADAERKKAAE